MTRRPASGLPRPRKRFGQHFLEPAWVAKLIDSLGARPSDHFLEVGPGRGALTIPLASRVASIVAVEIDRDLAAHLEESLPATVRVVCADFLDADVAAMVGPGSAPLRMVGNLPYNVSAPILFKLFGAAGGGAFISDATVMLQREVADRLTAPPGSGDYGVLGVYGALYAEATRVLALPPGAFRPPPAVQSAVVRLTFHPPPVELGPQKAFDLLVRGAFAHRRKTLANAIAEAAQALGQEPKALIARAGLDPSLRPAELALADFAALSRAVL